MCLLHPLSASSAYAIKRAYLAGADHAEPQHAMRRDCCHLFDLFVDWAETFLTALPCLHSLA